MIGRALGAGRLAYGAILLGRPELGQRLLGLQPDANATGAYLARISANRELLLGVMGAGLAGPAAADAALRWGMAVDSLDALAAVLSNRSGGHRPLPAALLAGASVAAVAAAGYALAVGDR